MTLMLGPRARRSALAGELIAAAPVLLISRLAGISLLNVPLRCSHVGMAICVARLIPFGVAVPAVVGENRGAGAPPQSSAPMTPTYQPEDDHA